MRRDFQTSAPRVMKAAVKMRAKTPSVPPMPQLVDTDQVKNTGKAVGFRHNEVVL